VRPARGRTDRYKKRCPGDADFDNLAAVVITFWNPNNVSVDALGAFIVFLSVLAASAGIMGPADVDHHALHLTLCHTALEC